jgi:dihydrofolate synthase/folylpolyglutamate synthase
VLFRSEISPQLVQTVADEATKRKVEPEFASSGDGYQAHNFGLALFAARHVLGDTGQAFLPTDQVRSVMQVPGRADVREGDPTEILDAAHNPDGARALAQLLPELAAGRDVVCCLAVLAEKDARGIVETLAPACSHFVCTQIPPEAVAGSGRPAADAHPAAELAELCRGAGIEAEAIADPLQAWERTKDLARERDAAALAAGSHYLLAQIWTERPAPSS